MYMFLTKKPLNLEKSRSLSWIVALKVDLEVRLRHPSPSHTKVPTWGDGSRDESVFVKNMSTK